MTFSSKPLEQAVHARKDTGPLLHHSDRGSQYLSIRYTERLADAGIEPSVGSVGDAYGNAMAETVIGLYKTEVINKQGPWKHRQAVEFATLAWVDWCLITEGYWSPSEISHRSNWRRCIIKTNRATPWRPDSHKRASGIPGADNI